LSRTRPLMMTSMTTIFGILPMAIDKSQAAEMWAPFGVTILMGMISATLLTLIIIPGLYVSLEKTIAGIPGFIMYLKGPFTLNKFIILFLILYNLFLLGIKIYFSQ
ncbi:MAG: efflux RND transporter permease subunit, partial [Candidatus Aureabacteria bacterium]|nr:efflux RND transporter permease subunit [Candidatus Auribacterota bacterium]